MAMEVERRDALIAHLQSKVRTLELNASSTSRRKVHREKVGVSTAAAADDDDTYGGHGANLEDDSSSGSSAELLFMVCLVSLDKLE